MTSVYSGKYIEIYWCKNGNKIGNQLRLNKANLATDYKLSGSYKNGKFMKGEEDIDTLPLRANWIFES